MKKSKLKKTTEIATTDKRIELERKDSQLKLFVTDEYPAVLFQVEKQGYNVQGFLRD